MDGSLGVLYRNRGVPQIATRGSMVSEQAMWASLQLLNHNPSEIPDDLTLLFEIIYPDNRIVINYGQRESLVLLAARNRHTGEYLPFFPDVYELAQKHGFDTPQVFTFDGLTAVIESCGAIDANHEGYVIEFSDGQRFKFKGDRYRELHKLISGLTFKNTLRAMANNTVADFIGIIPDEFLDEVRGWIAEIEAIRDKMKSQAVEAFDAAPKTSRKDFALWVQSVIVKDSQPYMYALLDGKPIESIIYKHIENMPDRSIVSIDQLAG